MAPARTKFVKSPSPNGNALGAAYFRFGLNLDNKTPLHGTPFVTFISDELGLSTTATLDEKGLNALYTDDKNNWLRIITIYAYAQIYIRACALIDKKTTQAGTNAFIDYASKLVKLTFHGNKILLNAAPEDWALLKNSVKSQTHSQAPKSQVAQPPTVQTPIAQWPQAMHAQATQQVMQSKASRHRYMLEQGPSLQRMRLG